MDAVVGANANRITLSSQTQYAGLFGISCYHNNVFNLYRNNTVIGSNIGNRYSVFDNQDPNNENGKITLGGYNDNETIRYYSIYEMSFACFGLGLSATQWAALNTAVTDFQINLNRNV